MFFKISQILLENTCARVFFNKVAGLRAFNLIKKKFQHGCFIVKFTKFLRTPILKNICERLLLHLHVVLFEMHEKDAANDAQLNIYTEEKM